MIRLRAPVPRCDNTAATTQQIQAWFQIINHGSSSVPLSSLTIRYFYTKDGSPASDQDFVCDYAAITGGGGNVIGVFDTFTGTNADEYLEIQFAAAAGSIGPGASTGEIQARIHTGAYATFTQGNDYSFDPTKTAFTDWANVTLYQNGIAISGTGA